MRLGEEHGYAGRNAAAIRSTVDCIHFYFDAENLDGYLSGLSWHLRRGSSVRGRELKADETG